MKISVGLPIYDGKLQWQSVASLLTETSIAHAQGDQLNVNFLHSCTNLAMGRNQLVKEFLASSNDRLVFLDADVTFEPGALVKIAHQPVDLVGGAYRLKQYKERYPIYLLPEPKPPGPSGLIEVGSVPTGFMSLSREVFEKFRAHYGERSYGIDGNRAYCYFQIPYRDGTIYTEDAYFCREWREMGGQVFLDPEIYLTHWQGNIPYPGHIGNWYRRLSTATPIKGNHMTKNQDGAAFAQGIPAGNGNKKLSHAEGATP